MDEYEHYDYPCDGDLQEAVPGKFVVFKGPMDLDSTPMWSIVTTRAASESSALFLLGYADVLWDMDVVRLNNPAMMPRPSSRAA